MLFHKTAGSKLAETIEKYLCLCFGKIPEYKWKKAVMQNCFLDKSHLKNTTQWWFLKLKISYKGEGFLGVACNFTKIEHGNCYFSKILNTISRKFIFRNKFIEHLSAAAWKAILIALAVYYDSCLNSLTPDGNQSLLVWHTRCHKFRSCGSYVN